MPSPHVVVSGEALALPFSAEEIAVYERAGYGTAFELGRRTAFVGIDFTNEFCGPEGADLAEAMAVHRLACGAPAWTAARTVVEVLMPAVIAAGIPAYWMIRAEPSNRPPLGAPGWSAADLERNSLVRPIRELGHGTVLTKTGPSAFFDTGLDTVLRRDGIDTVLLAGGVTSGCVRASAVDASSHGFRAVVVGDGVFDRSATSHAVALFEMSMKYAAIADAAQIAGRLAPSIPTPTTERNEE